jgi:hypothetical protein
VIEHLPECFLGEPCRSNGGGEHIPQGTVAGFPVTICGMCMYDCICERLRRVEQRQREDDNRALWDDRAAKAALEQAVQRVEAWLDRDEWGENEHIRAAVIAAIKGDSDE